MSLIRKCLILQKSFLTGENFAPMYILSGQNRVQWREIGLEAIYHHFLFLHLIIVSHQNLSTPLQNVLQCCPYFSSQKQKTKKTPFWLKIYVHCWKLGKYKRIKKNKKHQYHDLELITNNPSYPIYICWAAYDKLHNLSGP